MNKPRAVSQLCEMFWKLENEYSLLDIEIQGVKVWQYMRMPLYYSIAEKCGVLEKPHAQKQTTFGRLKKSLNYTKSLLFYNPFFIFDHHVDEIIIDHPRPKCVDEKNIDIYSQYYLNDLDRTKKDYLVIERPFLNGLHTKTNTSKRKFLDALIVLSALRGKLFSVHLNAGEVKLITELEAKLNDTFEIDIDFLSIVTKAISIFQNNYSLYRYLFSKLQPEKLVVLVSYAYGDAIKAAKDLGIETVEIQHGTFSKYHLGYSFPGRVEDLDYFPDKFMAWGDYWKKLNVIPLSEKSIVISGFTHFNNLRENYKEVVRKPSQLLILSQGALGSKIADKILGQIESLDGYSIVYKLHPGEYSRWEEYKSLVKLSRYPNVSIVKDEDIYRLFAESAFQVGVFSTAIYEGLGFDCRTILLDLPGVEYMRDLIEGDVVEILQENESILDVINTCSQKRGEYHYCYADFFGDTSPAVLPR